MIEDSAVMAIVAVLVRLTETGAKFWTTQTFSEIVYLTVRALREASIGNVPSFASKFRWVHGTIFCSVAALIGEALFWTVGKSGRD